MFCIKELIDNKLRDNIINSTLLDSANYINIFEILTQKNKSNEIFKKIKTDNSLTKYVSRIIPLYKEFETDEWINLNENLFKLIDEIVNYFSYASINVSYEKDYFINNTFIDDNINKYNIKFYNNSLIISYTEDLKDKSIYLPAFQSIKIIPYKVKEKNTVIELYRIIKNLCVYDKYMLSPFSSFKKWILDNCSHEEYETIYSEINDLTNYIISQCKIYKYLKTYKLTSTGTNKYKVNSVLVSENVYVNTDNPIAGYIYDNEYYIYQSYYSIITSATNLLFYDISNSNTVTVEFDELNDSDNVLTDTVLSNLDTTYNDMIKNYEENSFVLNVGKNIDANTVWLNKLYYTEVEDDTSVSYDSIYNVLLNNILTEQNLL